MGKGLIFFACSCCILVLTIVNLSIGPVISGKAASISGTLNCKYYKDMDDLADKNNADDDLRKYITKWAYDECVRKKGMHDMEYTSFIFDIVIGFICGLIGLLHLFDLKKDFVSNTGLIGLICGFVGFVLTFVYVIFNGLVYTSYYEGDIIKTDGDGIVAEYKGSQYECKYYDEKYNAHALVAKYSDYGKKQYNYDKDLQKTFTDKASCIIDGGSVPDIDDIISGSGTTTVDLITLCLAGEGKFNPPTISGTTVDPDECKNLYVQNSNVDQITHKDISDRFLTALILSLFVCLANIGLALFGFLLFKTPGDF